MQLAVSVNNVSYSYSNQSTPVLKNCSIGISTGERFGLFGPNGAGKTTLMSVMTGLLSPQIGNVTLLEKNVSSDSETKKLFGYVPQDFSFYQELNPVQNLRFFGAWYGMSKEKIEKRSDELLQILGLSDVRKKQVKHFSGGMKRRLNIAIGVMNKPAVIFLDEPTVGVDVQSRTAIIDYLLQLNTEGSTLIYTSHHLKEAEDLCTHIALIDNGSIIAHNSLENVLKQYNENDLEKLFLKLTGKALRD